MGGRRFTFQLDSPDSIPGTLISILEVDVSTVCVLSCVVSDGALHSADQRFRRPCVVLGPESLAPSKESDSGH